MLDALLMPARCLQVLEHAVCDCEDRWKQLAADALTAQQQERDTRCELAAAREQQAAAQRALQQQTQRLLAAERMRLADLRVSRALQGCVKSSSTLAETQTETPQACVHVALRSACAADGVLHACGWQTCG
jgi:hypothetical protein